MSEEQSLTGGKIRLNWNEETAEETGYELARRIIEEGDQDREGAFQRHIRNAYDGCTPAGYLGYVRGVYRAVLDAQEMLTEIEMFVDLTVDSLD